MHEQKEMILQLSLAARCLAIHHTMEVFKEVFTCLHLVACNNVGIL